jgi:hypothetical protein
VRRARRLVFQLAEWRLRSKEVVAPADCRPMEVISEGVCSEPVGGHGGERMGRRRT